MEQWNDLEEIKPEYGQICEVELLAGDKRLAKYTCGFTRQFFFDLSSIMPGYLCSVQRWREASEETKEMYYKKLKERQKEFMIPVD